MNKYRAMVYALLGVGLLLGLMLLFIIVSDGGRRVFGLFSLNHHGIVFYGKLEDQFGNALPNVRVNFDVRVNNGFRVGVDRGSVITDKGGNFKISGYSGSRLFVVPRIEGYAIASDNTEAIYSDLWSANERAHPDPNHPVVIKMWKAQGAEPLVGISKRYKLPYTNQPIHFDLIRRQIVSEGGDLKITVNRPAGIISERNPQVWKVTFETIDGGLLGSGDREKITYFAPQTGYMPSNTISSSDRLPEGGIGGFRTGFYVRSRNGQVYSKLRVDIGINETPEGPMYIEFEGVANTNFSRNWEGAGNTYLNPN